MNESRERGRFERSRDSVQGLFKLTLREVKNSRAMVRPYWGRGGRKD